MHAKHEVEWMDSTGVVRGGTRVKKERERERANG